MKKGEEGDMSQDVGRPRNAWSRVEEGPNSASGVVYWEIQRPIFCQFIGFRQLVDTSFVEEDWVGTVDLPDRGKLERKAAY